MGRVLLAIVGALIGFYVGAGGVAWAGYQDAAAPIVCAFTAGLVLAVVDFYLMIDFVLRRRPKNASFRLHPFLSKTALGVAALLVVLSVNVLVANVLGYGASGLFGKLAGKGIGGWEKEKTRLRDDAASLWGRFPTAPSFWKEPAHQANIKTFQEVEALFSRVDADVDESVDRLKAGDFGGFNEFVRQNSWADPNEIIERGNAYFRGVEHYARGRSTLVSAGALVVAIGACWLTRRVVLKPPNATAPGGTDEGGDLPSASSQVPSQA